MKILITGAAGFIGMHLSKRLLELNKSVVGIDSLNDYYDVNLKESRLIELENYKNFTFEKINLADNKAINNLFERNQFTHVINLAAQAGVRYSLENPQAYIESNLQGFTNILEGCRHYKIQHLIYASSSSVYGANTKMPFSTSHNVDHPVSLYAATKKSNELLAHSYSHLYDIPTTGLRFFTVYGPWGRPDMAYFSFTNNILEGKEIKVFNNGDMYRDFTYIDDVIQGVVNLLERKPNSNESWDRAHPDPSSSYAPYKIYNIGNNKPVKLIDFIETLEKHLNKVAYKEYLPMQPGDVQSTYADIDDLQKDTGFKPNTSIDTGLSKFVKWYKDYYKV